MSVKSQNLERNSYIAGVLAWLVPGAGHLYLGEKPRGLLLCVGVCVTFFLGVLLGGVVMVDIHYSKPWFLAQILTGAPCIIATLLQNMLHTEVGVGRGVELGQVYTGVAGMMNLLAVLDALLRGQGLSLAKPHPKDTK